MSVCVWGGGALPVGDAKPRAACSAPANPAAPASPPRACNHTRFSFLKPLCRIDWDLCRYFGNVCELDLIFNFHKAYYILDEILIAGAPARLAFKASNFRGRAAAAARSGLGRGRAGVS